MIASRPVFRGPLTPKGGGGAADTGAGIESEKPDCFEESDKQDQNTENADKKRAARRAAKAVRSLCHCAEFRYFVTLTLDPHKIDRFDVAAIIRKMSQWCDNKVRRNGLCYILVPERHKDGAIHFHGFFNDALPVVDSGTLSLPGQKKPRKPRSKAQRAEWLEAGGQIVYNLPSWTLGFTTAIELYGEKQQAINYVIKYISKQVEDNGDKIGGRWYYHGGEFKKPEITADMVDFVDICCNFPQLAASYYQFTVEETGVRFMVRTYKPREYDEVWTYM